MKKSIKTLLVIAAIAASTLTASAVKPSYRGFVDFSPTFAVAYSNVSPSELSLYSKPNSFTGLVSTTHGVQINRHLFVGVGAGLIFARQTGFYAVYDFNEPESDFCLYAPIYADIRYDFLITKKASPFVACKLGYECGIVVNGAYNIYGSSGDSKSNNGFYFQPVVGMRFRINNHVGFNLGLTLLPTYYRTVEEQFNIEDGYDIRASYSRYNFGLVLGFDF